MKLLTKEVEVLLRELGLQNGVQAHDTRFYPTDEIVRGIMKRARMRARLSKVSELAFVLYPVKLTRCCAY